jgi:lipopolysaccharide/colanic/teichoic acid biosynthesis glycosyltransferase
MLCTYFFEFVQWAAFEEFGKFDLVIWYNRNYSVWFDIKFVLLMLWCLMSGINIMQ